ncbi:MAG: nucleotide pyrophosphohydrolase [Oligoflexia bacterium]|nr:nucleotide pyrophosphohydrolase [Oligoflexia bacterium]
MATIEALTELVLRFRNERDWAQFHKPKDLAISLMLEAAEVAEHFQWRNDQEISEHVAAQREAIGDELSDVLYWVLVLAHDLKVDLPQAFQRKMKKNEQKYPVEKAKGRHSKYTNI